MADKVKLNFVLGDKKYAYNGYPEKREQDFFQMFYKIAGKDGDADPEDVHTCWKQNFPESSRSSESVFADFEKEAAKQKKKRDKKKDGGDDKEKEKEKEKEREREREREKEKEKEERRREKEKEKKREKEKEKKKGGVVPDPDLENFIEEVLSTSHGRKQTLEKAVEPPAQPQHVDAGPKDDHSQPVQIKVQLETGDAKKMIQMKRTATRDELFTEIDKKWDCTALYGEFNVSFEDEEGDRIEIDDTDTLHMFFDSVPDGKKGKMIVSKVAVEAPVRASDPQAEEAPAPAPAAQAAAPTPAAAGGESSTTKAEDDTPNPNESEADLPKCTVVRTLNAHTEAVFGAAFNTSGDKFCSSSKDKTVKIWSWGETPKVIHSIKAHSSLVLSCDFADNDSHVVSGSADSTVRVWHVGSGKKQCKLKQHTDKVYCVRFAKGSKNLATASVDKTARVWAVENPNKPVLTLEKHTEPVYSCAFDSEGKMLATGSDDRTIRVWDWKAGVESAVLKGHEKTIWSVGFSDDGRYLISGSMGFELMVWDMRQQKLLKTMMAKNAVHNARFIKNDKYILSCGRDNSLSIYETASMSTEARSLSLASRTEAHSKIVYHTAIHNDTILSTSLDSTIRVWKLPTDLQ